MTRYTHSQIVFCGFAGLIKDKSRGKDPLYSYIHRDDWTSTTWHWWPQAHSCEVMNVGLLPHWERNQLDRNRVMYRQIVYIYIYQISSVHTMLTPKAKLTNLLFFLADYLLKTTLNEYHSYTSCFGRCVKHWHTHSACEAWAACPCTLEPGTEHKGGRVTVTRRLQRHSPEGRPCTMVLYDSFVIQRIHLVLYICFILHQTVLVSYYIVISYLRYYCTYQGLRIPWEG